MFYLLSIAGSFDSSIGKLLMAAVLGGIIGWERERRGRPAGLRTHILVCVGVTLMMLVSEHIFERYKTFAADSIIRVDPARIAAQVVTGIGFLGAGTIMRFRATVRGLTTAASMGCGGIGLAAGSSCYVPAIITTIIALLHYYYCLFLNGISNVTNTKHSSYVSLVLNQILLTLLKY